MKHLIPASLIILYISCNSTTGLKSEWTNLEEGLTYAEFTAPEKSITGDSKITVLRINPSYFDFKLICAGETDKKCRTIEEHANKNNLIAGINAGMFKTDYLTNTGYMKNHAYINNPTLSKDNTFFAFDRKDSTVSYACLIDRECQNWETLRDRYHCFSQGIRMIDCNRKNKWQQQDKIWSTVAIGCDKDGNILFLFTRSPYSVHDFIDILLALPINISGAMYLEGGPEASFLLNHSKLKTKKCGSYETGFNENDNNTELWKIPNVIGIVRK